MVGLFVLAASHHSALPLGLGFAELGALRGGILFAILDAAVDTEAYNVNSVKTSVFV
ncbi:hypothetical protein D7B24_005289 [Verticillium nonalfalfae]|uniref:Uncharacterized protein n=1 Tax=Verticillium nonalfalfae TaxID=1051616 RepID=A0A3M9YC72_9PEZI|nr:uncharacterized protein D7B24_005289 [Verticillium nonalfalfae]RNJ57974.1 hypothetical protein D7B24_005289 [Verticillium nonalfalfae]